MKFFNRDNEHLKLRKQTAASHNALNKLASSNGNLHGCCSSDSHSHNGHVGGCDVECGSSNGHVGGGSMSKSMSMSASTSSSMSNLSSSMMSMSSSMPSYPDIITKESMHYDGSSSASSSNSSSPTNPSKQANQFISSTNYSSSSSSSEFSPLTSWIIRIVTPELPSSNFLHGIPTNKKDLALNLSSSEACCASYSSYARNESVYTAVIRIAIATLILIGLPFGIWDSHPEQSGLYSSIRHLEIVWASLMHVSVWPIVLPTVWAVAMCPRGGVPVPHWMVRISHCILRRKKSNGSQLQPVRITSHWKITLIISLLLSTVVILHMMLQMAYPSLLWNPFMWGWYTVYYPQNIHKAFQGACLQRQDRNARAPLCLGERQWRELSSGMLSSYNPEDVLTVQRGLDYLQHQSGGVLINALARNIAESVPALRQNVEGLLPFYGNDSREKLSIVVFENDSDDGTREMFKKWAKEEKEGLDRYNVDLISCGDNNPDCKLGIMDRYDNMPYFSNPNASGVGKLGEFRQIILDYIMKSEDYKDFSHMLILDVDLGTSISPLGLLHTLGLENDIAQNHVIATSSSQVWPGTFGTIIPPYDLSAFRPKETKNNSKIRQMHKTFCELQPPGDRWRNMCEACSPMQLFLIQSADDVTYHGGRPYQVTSAFNGLTIYPLDLIRSKGDHAHYDAGDDGQRCEHVGFHLSLKDIMYVNPKWTMNLKPSKPGGPTGFRAIKTLFYAVFGRPAVMVAITLGNLSFFFLFVSCVWMIGVSVKSLILLNLGRERMILGDGGDDYGIRKGISVTE